MPMINSQQPASGQMYKEGATVVNVANMQEEALGGAGMHVLDDTAAHTPGTGKVYRALHCVTDTVIAAFVAHASAPVTGTFVGVSHKAGFWLFGKFTSITLTSGDVYAYLGAEV